jgi:hypothetical protein
MLFNLLSNAIKFTRQGTIGLQVTATEAALHFTVWDTGIGIPLEKQALLFRPYSQIRNEVVNGNEGTGLGLALTQKLAELHGGKVELVSAVNQGSRFTICLPKKTTIATPTNATVSSAQPEELRRYTTSVKTAAPGEVELAAISSPPCQPKSQTSLPDDEVAENTILLVEDNSLNARLIKTYLRKLGYQVTVAQSGIELWRALERSRPALVLMDVCLPEVDGLTLTQQMRADHRYQTIPVIAQTAMAMAGDREACLAAGANAYLSKPIDLEALARVVAEYIR